MAAAERLQDQLDRIGAETRRLVPQERLQPMEDAVAELLASGIEQKILPAGAPSPAFELKDSNRRTVRSRDLLAAGPLIIKFFRGRWCPYCVAELSAWSELYAGVRERGASMVAISPQTLHQSSLQVEQHRIPFPVLVDANLVVAGQFGLVYEVPAALQKQYRGTLVNLPFINDDPSWRLPLPATYVICPDGRIVFAEAHAEFRVRPEPAEVLAALNRCV